MQTKFHVLSRLDLLETLTAQFGERIVSLQAHGQDDAIVLRDSDTDPIPASEWMSTLASHQFFLCCPGAAQPVCHNAIEAMAVGVIPVIEYGDRFQPELMDGVNSICFQGRKGLAVAMRRISAMSPEKRQRMSVQAAAYYDEHLDGTKFIKRLRDELNTDIVDQLSMPFHDSNLFSKGSPASGRVKSTQTRAA